MANSTSRFIRTSDGPNTHSPFDNMLAGDFNFSNATSSPQMLLTPAAYTTQVFATPMPSFTPINSLYTAENGMFPDTTATMNQYQHAGASVERFDTADIDDEGHSMDCSGHHSFSTPPPSPRPAKALKSGSTLLGSEPALTQYNRFSPAEVMQVLGKRQTSKLLVQYERLHRRAVAFLPDATLAPGRYWIGVVNIGRKVNNVTSTKHFAWMKGNRKTTVRTVWHAYHAATLTEDFVLRLGLEPVEMTDLVEELDYFDDRFICFRAVQEGADKNEGRNLLEDAVPKELTEATQID